MANVIFPSVLDAYSRADALKRYLDASVRPQNQNAIFDYMSPQQNSVNAFVPSYGATSTASAAPSPDDMQFILGRGGHNTGTNAPGLHPDFAARLAAAGRAYEAETGRQSYFGELSRDYPTQAEYYRRYQSGTGGLAAPPGTSRHESGMGVDIRRGDFRDWLASNAGRFGVETLKGDAYRLDPVHFQMMR